MNTKQIAKLKELARKAIEKAPWPFYLTAFHREATPENILELIAEAERTTAPVSLTDEQAWTIITEICGTQLTRVGSRKFQVVEINDMATAGEVARALLAAAPTVQTRIVVLLREARATLEMWKDVAPAVSLCADIDAALASPAPIQQEPCATFEGYLDGGTPIIKWTGPALPAGAKLYAAAGGE